MDSVRIDQWLWAARLFKTRALAKKALESGKVRTAGQKIKPSKLVSLDQVLTVTQGYVTKTLVVTGISDRRGSATEAAKLYEETAASLAARTQEQAERKALAASFPKPAVKPNKKARRQIIRFKNSREGD